MSGNGRERDILQAAARRARRAAVRTASALAYRSGATRLLKGVGDGWELGTDAATGAGFPWVRRRRSGSVQILVYHRVNDERDPFFPATPVGVFAGQMEFLASEFTLWPLDTAVEALRRRDLPERAVVVTFDDGYMDNFAHAFPILKRLAIPATIFLATDAVGTGRALWHDRVFAAFRKTTERTLEGFGPSGERYPLTSLEARLRSQDRVLAILRELDDRARGEWVARLVEKLGVADRRESPGLMLGWDEVRAMAQAGISFGSHSVTHPVLSRMDVDRAQEEIHESKRCIERHLGVEVRAFAYPNGRSADFHPDTKRLLRDAGYACAVTTLFGVNRDGVDLFELRRGQPWEEDLPTFAVKFHWYGLRSA